MKGTITAEEATEALNMRWSGEVTKPPHTKTPREQTKGCSIKKPRTSGGPINGYATACMITSRNLRSKPRSRKQVQDRDLSDSEPIAKDARKTADAGSAATAQVELPQGKEAGDVNDSVVEHSLAQWTMNTVMTYGQRLKDQVTTPRTTLRRAPSNNLWALKRPSM